MTLEVIGAGFGRTGTLSLKYALEMLGYQKCLPHDGIAKSPGSSRPLAGRASW